MEQPHLHFDYIGYNYSQLDVVGVSCALREPMRFLKKYWKSGGIELLIFGKQNSYIFYHSAYN